MREHFLNILKLIFAFLLIPLTAVITISFSKSLNGLAHVNTHSFWLGVLIYVVVHAFIFEPQGIYEFGQKIGNSLFKFYPPLANVGTRILPVYTLLSLILFCFVQLFYKKTGYETSFMFLAGFTLALHIILTAKELREENKSAVSPNYLLFIQLIYIFIILLTAVIFTFVVPKFSFASFFYSAAGLTKETYLMIFRQLFVP